MSIDPTKPGMPSAAKLRLVGKALRSEDPDTAARIVADGTASGSLYSLGAYVYDCDPDQFARVIEDARECGDL
jgi:hypothetical protein